MDQAKLFLTHFTGVQSYVIFYFLLVGCGIGLPFNSDFVIITASVIAATLGTLKLSFLIPVAFLGLLTGDAINFWVARIYGKRILNKPPFKWILTPEKVSAGERYLQGKGNSFLFCVRFLPLIRTVLYFTAGSLQVKPKTFFLLDGASTLIYLFALMNAAFYAGENIDPLIATLKKFQFALLGLLILGAFVFIILKKSKRPALS